MAEKDEKIFEGEFEFEANIPDVVFPQGNARAELPDDLKSINILRVEMVDQDRSEQVVITSSPIVDAADKVVRNWLAMDLERVHGVRVEASLITPTAMEANQHQSVSFVMYSKDEMSGGVTLLDIIVSHAFSHRLEECEQDATALADEARTEGWQSGEESGRKEAEDECERRLDDVAGKYENCMDKLDEQTANTEEATKERDGCVEFLDSIMSLVSMNATIILGLEAKPDEENGPTNFAIGVYGPAGDLLVRAESSDAPGEEDLEDMWKVLIKQADDLEKENPDVWLQTGAPAKDLQKIALGVQMTPKGAAVTKRRGPDAETLTDRKKAELEAKGLEGLGALVKGVFRARPAGSESQISRDVVQVTKKVRAKQPSLVKGLGTIENIRISGWVINEPNPPEFLDETVKTLDDAEELLRSKKWVLEPGKRPTVSWESPEIGELTFDPFWRIRVLPGMLRDHFLVALMEAERARVVSEREALDERYNSRLATVNSRLATYASDLVTARKQIVAMKDVELKLRTILEFIGKALGPNPTIQRAQSGPSAGDVFSVAVLDVDGNPVMAVGTGKTAEAAWRSMMSGRAHEWLSEALSEEDRRGLLRADLVTILQTQNPAGPDAKPPSVTPGRSTPPLKGLPGCVLEGLTEGQLRLFDDLGLPACARGDRNSPCERLKRSGVGDLREEDILSIILDIEPPEAARILADGGGVIGLAKAPIGRLLSIEGVTLELALKIKAAGEFCMRIERADFPHGVVVSKPEHIRPFLKSFRTRDRESFWVVLMDAKNQVIDVRETCSGTIDACSIHPRDILTPVLIEGATAFILVHNHPSGAPRSSYEDVVLSVRMKEIAKTMGLRMLDSLIVAGNEIVSLRAEGDL